MTDHTPLACVTIGHGTAQGELMHIEWSRPAMVFPLGEFPVPTYTGTVRDGHTTYTGRLIESVREETHDEI